MNQYPELDHIREGATAETQYLLDIIDRQYQELEAAGWFKGFVFLHRGDGSKEMLHLASLERECDLLRDVVVEVASANVSPYRETLQRWDALTARAREVLATNPAEV